jgi:tetratricopeptide (TPR) repeat protein
VKKRLDLYQEAHQLLDQILALDDSNIPSFDVLKEKGDIALLAKQFNQAAALFLKVIYLDANAQPVEKFNLLRKIAFSYEQVKKFKQAESVYQKMLQEFEDQDLRKQARDHLERLKLVPRETQE